MTPLEQSIEHWERLAAGTQVDEEDPCSEHCALCDTHWDYSCGSCPIYECTGFSDCETTPWSYAASAWYASHGDNEPPTPRQQAAMQAQVDFLKSLLPHDDDNAAVNSEDS